MINRKTKQQLDSSREKEPPRGPYLQGRLVFPDQKNPIVMQYGSSERKDRTHRKNCQGWGKNEKPEVFLSEKSTARRMPPSIDQLAKVFDKLCDGRKVEVMERC